MKIIKNNAPKPEYPKTVTCFHCKSILEIEEGDLISRTYIEHDQRQGNYQVTRETWGCPCCNQTNKIS